MSRREDRESDSKRHRSRLDRESSPKRTRRDGKPATERPDKSWNSGILEPSDQNQKYSKINTGPLDKEYDSKTNGHHEKGTTRSSDLTAVPRSRTIYQHDDRYMNGQFSRSFTRRNPTDRGWWKDSKHERREAETSKTLTNSTHQQQQQNGNYNNNNSTDNRSRENPTTARKRPSFREKKLLTPANANKAALTIMPPAGRRREEREGYNPTRRDSWRSGGGGTHRVDKWKHDLYNDANRSPTPKNEEDQIAKVEALLAS